MNPEGIAVDDVVQIDPAHDERFGGCLVIVTELKSWGVQGFVKIPKYGDAYYRAEFSAVRRIGPLAWKHE